MKYTRSLDGEMRVSVNVTFRFSKEELTRLDKVCKAKGCNLRDQLRSKGLMFVDWESWEETNDTI